jgi:myosin-crossreactive antigen
VKINIDTSKYDLPRFKKVIDSAWFNGVIMSEGLKVVRDNNVSIIYEFFDMNNDSMFTLEYSPHTYNK